uniref:Uncharacterized protein n=1 Tax=Rhizophora mucronata TaxID=61149 RepID=A0A2P2P7D5_RHIMU
MMSYPEVSWNAKKERKEWASSSYESTFCCFNMQKLVLENQPFQYQQQA